MERVDCTTGKRSSFRSIGGAPKATITLLLTLFTTIGTFGQTIDWSVAPLNPVPVYYTLNHFNLHGPVKEVKGKSIGNEVFDLYFNESGKLTQSDTKHFGNTSRVTYLYTYDSKGHLMGRKMQMINGEEKITFESTVDISLDEKGLVKTLGNYHYTYDNKKRLILCVAKDKNGKVNYRRELTYNALGQIISEKITEPNVVSKNMEVKEFKFNYIQRKSGGWDIEMYYYKDGSLGQNDRIPIITSSFVRQKRIQMFDNPTRFMFDKDGIEAFNNAGVKVKIDQYNNYLGNYTESIQKSFYTNDISYYNNIKSVTKYKETNTNTTTAGSNTSGQTTGKDYANDKITASYNENASLYVRKINDATVYFYQHNSRINQPLHYAIIEDGKHLRLFTTYTKDYYSAYALNDMSPEKLYPLTHRNGVFYLYINQNNGNFSFNYQGKALSSTQYELYKSKGDYTVVKIKSDNTIYLFKSDLTKAAISNSQSKGVLVHFADKHSVFVESGQPTQPTQWKIEKENDKYYLINSSENKKYSISDYEKSINWGIYTIH